MLSSFSPDLTDMELVRLCQARGAKDDRPFQELLHRHQTLVWRICYSYTHNAHDAEDLAQDVFFKVYRNLSTFAGRASFKTWISHIAANTCKNELRHRSRRPQLSASDVDTMAEFLPSQTNIEAEWQERSRQTLLIEAIQQLPPDASEIIMLKDLEQRPYTEIAQKLGISVSAAKMRVQRARLALQRLYHQLAENGVTS